MDTGLKAALAELILLVENEQSVLGEFPLVKFPDWQNCESLVHAIGHGNYSSVVADCGFSEALAGEKAKEILSEYPATGLGPVLASFARHIVALVPAFRCQLLAIALLQLAVQSNFTGPESDISGAELWFPGAEAEKIQHDAVALLQIEGKPAYELMHEPLLLAVSLLIFENLQKVSYSLIGQSTDISIEDITADCVSSVEALDVLAHPVHASLVWWRSRAVQVHMAVLLEPSDVLALLSSALLTAKVGESLSVGESRLDTRLKAVFLVENARNSIHAHAETLAHGFLRDAAEVSQFQFVLTGAKAKRTKYQTFHTASLVLLAKSAESAEFNALATHHADFALDSDLLLEKPLYEQLDDLELEDQPAKKVRLEIPGVIGENRLFPVAASVADIPRLLLLLDPNNQPNLADLDSIQLLLRFASLKQTSPSGNMLVDEELAAVVARIIYAESPSVNWAVFGRALWERSILETARSRTVERGILQMTALVDDMGLSVGLRILPGAALEPVLSRLRYIHQLPLMAAWAMDAKLAEQYMALGVLKSAIEIYLRLQMPVEAALCYAAVDNEPEATELLEKWVETHPTDARALSVLGDITEKPELWVQAWEVGRYAKAKASLARYYYNPPAASALSKDLGLALENMHQCLVRSPLSYENWFFYGCCGLEAQNFDLAAEAFTRCVSLDETSPHAWSNLASALLRLDKPKQAFTALKRALQQGETSKSWRIFENYLTVAVKLGEWNDVLFASRELLLLRQADGVVGSELVDIPIVEQLLGILVDSEFPTENRLTHFQSSCLDLVTNLVPRAASDSPRCWRIVARVEMWRHRPWLALEAHEKAFRAAIQNAELSVEKSAWEDAVEACVDLVDAYESLGPLLGKHGAGDSVCADWKYKSRQCVRSLMSKGRASWQDSEQWGTLEEMKERL